MLEGKVLEPIVGQLAKIRWVFLQSLYDYGLDRGLSFEFWNWLFLNLQTCLCVSGSLICNFSWLGIIKVSPQIKILDAANNPFLFFLGCHSFQLPIDLRVEQQFPILFCQPELCNEFLFLFRKRIE
jgi:hypothetical protein